MRQSAPVRYIVTGGAGFIGSNFVKTLVRQHAADINILVIDSLTYAGNIANIAEELNLPNIDFANADIRDRDMMKKIVSEYDPTYIVNFAAESHVDRSITDPGIFLETNILGVQSLLDAARASWQKPDGSWTGERRFLQISTDEVYGALARDFESPQPLHVSAELRRVVGDRQDVQTFGKKYFNEQTPLSPHSPYSASKASADMIVMAYHDTYGMPVLITRCSNNYGPYQFPEKLIPLLINNILAGRKLPVYGRGLNVRDWLYVEDHCLAVDTVLRHGTPGQIYNIGGFNEQQNIDIVHQVIDLVAEMTNTPPRQDLIAYVADRQGHDMRYAIDPAKTAVELGWYPRTPFKDGIRMTVKWYLDNIPWIESVTSGEYLKYYSDMYDNR